MLIRDETPSDKNAIFKVTAEAFEPMPFSNGYEPFIIDRLREDGDLTLSLVAIETDTVVGHITFSPVTINNQGDNWFGLGPVSVAAHKQREGIGSALIHEGLRRLKKLGANGCALIGNPDYYSRFGFQSDGQLIYGNVPIDKVQWLAFGAAQPIGHLKFSRAFSAKYAP